MRDFASAVRHNVRYALEHSLIPMWFFKDKDRFVGALLDDSTLLFRVVGDLFKEQEAENPYKAEDFAVEAGRLTENVMAVEITFPEPEEEPLCYRSFLFFDRDMKNLRCFCLEKGGDGDPPFLCGWDEERRHLNYGHCGPDPEQVFLRCADIYMEQCFGMRRRPAEPEPSAADPS